MTKRKIHLKIQVLMQTILSVFYEFSFYLKSQFLIAYSLRTRRCTKKWDHWMGLRSPETFGIFRFSWYSVSWRRPYSKQQQGMNQRRQILQLQQIEEVGTLVYVQVCYISRENALQSRDCIANLKNNITCNIQANMASTSL